MESPEPMDAGGSMHICNPSASIASEMGQEAGQDREPAVQQQTTKGPALSTVGGEH